MAAESREGDLVLCTVEKIEKTTVFVSIEDNGQGTIVTSEIAPGRIRNLREYVIPGKRIVCKILEIDRGNIRLSLRRVSTKEKKEVMDKYEREKNSLSILRSVVKENAEEVARKIKEKEANVYDFLQYCRTQPDKLLDYLSKEETERICKILEEKKAKQVEVRKEFSLSSKLPDGLTRIKKILLPYKDKITYLAAGRFVIKLKAQDYKKANSEVQGMLQDIEAKSKQENCKYETKEK